MNPGGLFAVTLRLGEDGRASVMDNHRQDDRQRRLEMCQLDGTGSRIYRALVMSNSGAGVGTRVGADVGLSIPLIDDEARQTAEASVVRCALPLLLLFLGIRTIDPQDCHVSAHVIRVPFIIDDDDDRLCGIYAVHVAVIGVDRKLRAQYGRSRSLLQNPLEFRSRSRGHVKSHARPKMIDERLIIIIITINIIQ